MTRIFVFSDIHGKINRLKELSDVIDKCDLAYFLGDGLDGLLENEDIFKGKLVYVHGNCDGGFDEKVLQVEDVKILLTHGHKHSVKFSLLRLGLYAREIGVNVALFGHTHRAVQEDYYGVTLINPGALGNPLSDASYAILEINAGVVNCKIVKIK